MERSEFGLRRLTIVVAVCFIALPVLVMVSMTYKNSTFNLSKEFAAEAMVLREKAKNVTRLSTVTESENNSFQPTSLVADKLLGGLLASAFDEGSCISRYRSSMYHKTSPYKPSLYLLSKLRKYENRHKRCGPYTKSYIKAVKEFNSSHANRTTGCNYIVWLPANGLGNRIVSLASAFLYALLTNRVLLVHHGTDMDDLFCEPFPNTSWLLPADFPLKNQFDSFKMRNIHSHGNLLKNNNMSSSTLLQQPAFLLLYLAYDYEDHDKLFYQDQNQGFLRKVPWLILKSGQYFVPSLFSISTFRKELSILFPDRETVFHHLGRYLFHPSNQAWGLITRFYQAYLEKADERIGLQIRLFHPESSPSHLVMKQILSCTEKENLLPQLDKQKHVALASPFKNQTLKAILIASLHSIYYENLRNMYWMKPTVNGEAIGVYQPSHEEYQQFGDNMHNVKAWAEMYMLSMTDVLVTSTWSTFGYVAQGLGGLKPWILFIPDNQTIPDPPCQRAMSMEPCFHYPPSYDRKANMILDNVDHGPHIRHCEDVSWGLKLVNNDHKS